MKIVQFDKLTAVEQQALFTRTADTFTDVDAIVKEVLEAVQRGGDNALRELTVRFDGVRVEQLYVSKDEISAAGNAISTELRAAVHAAIENIKAFHLPQIPPAYEVETAPGVLCRREWRPIRRVGLYIPGGTAPLLSTMLMLGIPAKLAGCPEIIVCTPPLHDGGVAPAILYAANALGVTNIVRAGGAQAVAAMACGTESIPAVEKIFGPGNRFVAAAKALVAQSPYNVAIDVFAGPTEVLVIADDSAPASWIAADLLAQAEHGPDSHVLLFTPSAALAEAVSSEVAAQVQRLPRKNTAIAAIEHSALVVVRDVREAIELSNRYAPEHLILAVERADSYLSYIQSAGSVFAGPLTSAVFGDYSSGTNHTLPTAGAARTSGGVTVESFMKPIFFQSMTPKGFTAIAGTAATLARAEGLEGHACAVDIRKEQS